MSTFRVRLTERELFPRVRREGEPKDGHWCDEEARHDQVEEVVEGPASDPHHKGDVQVRFRTTVVDHFVPGSRHACKKHIHYSYDALVISKITAGASTRSQKNGILPHATLHPHNLSGLLFQIFWAIFFAPPFELFILQCTESCFTGFAQQRWWRKPLRRGFGIVDWQGTPRILQATPHISNILTKHLQVWFLAV